MKAQTALDRFLREPSFLKRDLSTDIGVLLEAIRQGDKYQQIVVVSDCTDWHLTQMDVRIRSLLARLGKEIRFDMTHPAHTAANLKGEHGWRRTVVTALQLAALALVPPEEAAGRLLYDNTAPAYDLDAGNHRGDLAVCVTDTDAVLVVINQLFNLSLIADRLKFCALINTESVPYQFRGKQLMPYVLLNLLTESFELLGHVPDHRGRPTQLPVRILRNISEARVPRFMPDTVLEIDSFGNIYLNTSVTDQRHSDAERVVIEFGENSIDAACNGYSFKGTAKHLRFGGGSIYLYQGPDQEPIQFRDLFAVQGIAEEILPVLPGDELLIKAA